MTESFSEWDPMADHEQTLLARSQQALESHNSQPATASSYKTAAERKPLRRAGRRLPATAQCQPSHSEPKLGRQRFCHCRNGLAILQLHPWNRHKPGPSRFLIQIRLLCHRHAKKQSPASTLRYLSDSMAYRQSRRLRFADQPATKSRHQLATGVLRLLIRWLRDRTQSR